LRFRLLVSLAAGRFHILRLPSFHGSSEEPLRLLRITAGALLLLGTVIAIALALSGVAPRAIQLIGIFWAIYGFLVGITSGILEPVIDGVARALMDWGLIRAGGGWSAIEAMVARGQLEAAAEEYLSRAKDPRDRDLYDRRLDDPGRAMAELRRLIDRHPDEQGAAQWRRALSAMKAERFKETKGSAL
jgi:hypothetical protein